MHPYAGDEAFPVSASIPDDGDPRSAATVNVAFEALFDRTAWLNARHGFSFSLSEPLTDVEQAIWNPGLQRWFVAGGTKIVRSSTSGGWRWDASTLIPGAYSALTLKSIAADSVGNMVVPAQTSSSFFDYTVATNTWLERATMSQLADPYIAFDPVANSFACVGNNGLGTVRVQTSANRIAWTLSTLPAGLVDSIVSISLARVASNGAGRMVLTRGPYSNAAAESRVRVGYSSDGGVTWNYSGELSFDVVVEKTPIPASNGGDTWLMAIYRTTGTPATRIMRSDNGGTTWLQVASLSSVAIISVAWMRGEWIGLTSTGELLSSLDGATWRRMMMSVEAPAQAVFAGPLNLLAFGNNAVWPSTRGSNNILPAVT